MNCLNQSRIRSALTLAAALMVAGCASPAYRKSDAAVRSAQTAAMEIQNESSALQSAIDVLDRLVTDPPANLRPGFEAYGDAVDRLYVSIERADRAMKRMQQKQAAYVANAERELGAMNYQVTREHVEARKTAMRAQARTLQSRYVETREVVLPLLAYLEDIRKVLRADPTVSGLEGVRDIAVNAVKNGRKVETAVAQLAGQLADSSRELSSFNLGKAAPPEEAPMMAQSEEKHGMTAWIRTTLFRMKR